MIQLQSVSKLYRKTGENEVRALQEVSLDIGKNEFVAISGPSGSGKSTLMNIMGLLDRPTQGSYSLADQGVHDLSADQSAKIRNKTIGFVFQAFHLLPKTSAVENVELPLVYSDRSNSRELALRALKAVGLEDRVTHFPGELSGGQQQRVAIARALVNEPDIILADEPTGNLDSTSGKEIMDIFRQLHGEGKTIVLVTHDNYIAEHADRLIKMEDGRIVSDEDNNNANNNRNNNREKNKGGNQ
ncbi:MAG: ABC transporter ATP-binding protein [bacterium]|nr:ABC transporter ATP-binding protein [bacterium]